MRKSPSEHSKVLVGNFGGLSVKPNRYVGAYRKWNPDQVVNYAKIKFRSQQKKPS